MKHFVEHLLAWPRDTGVLGSFIVTTILGVPAYVKAMKTSKKRHNEKIAQDTKHHDEKLAQDRQHHEDLKQHITVIMSKPESVQNGHSGNLPETLDNAAAIG